MTARPGPVGPEPAPARVRPATAADVDAVTALEERIFGRDAWSRASVAEELTGRLRGAVVAVDDAGALQGYAVLLAAGDVGDLQRIAVAPDSRRHGVASTLLQAVLSGPGVSGLARVLLEVRADNAAALAFYRAHGFGEIARRRGYYADGTDAVVMERPLSPAADR